MTSTNFGNPGKDLQQLSTTIENLDSLFFKLYNLMEDQINAVIAADMDKVVQLTEEHTLLQREYKKTEKLFVDELENCLSKTEDEVPAVNMETLKKMYPTDSLWIQRVKTTFSEHTSKLMNKQRQLIDLLEFALIRNSRLMYSIYNSHSDKLMHYNPAGSMNGIQAGVAINQEI